jgi:hypothetical protein
MKVKRNYKDESEKLAKAIDIAIESFRKFNSFNLTESQVDTVIKAFEERRFFALNPEPQFKKLASLEYLIEETFTPFQDGAGEAVEYFWKKIAEANLDYKRENKLRKILDRGKIKGRIEYEYVTDMIVIAQQENMVTNDEAVQLSEMLATYERSHA